MSRDIFNLLTFSILDFAFSQIPIDDCYALNLETSYLFDARRNHVPVHDNSDIVLIWLEYCCRLPLLMPPLIALSWRTDFLVFHWDHRLQLILLCRKLEEHELIKEMKRTSIIKKNIFWQPTEEQQRYAKSLNEAYSYRSSIQYIQSHSDDRHRRKTIW